MQGPGSDELNLSPIPVTRSSMPSFDEYVEEIAPIWESRWLTNMGVKHRELQAKLEEYLDVEHICLFTNGHLALEAIFEAMGVGSDGRKEVITTPYTFASTTHAIVRKGLKPVMVDVRASDCTLDPALVEAAITPDTCAIVPVHVYGNICDNEELQAIAARHDLKVIYDAAHAFGVRTPGTPVAAMGNASMFSFHATKVFNTLEGGAVTFNGHPSFEPRLDQWKNFGITSPEDVEYVGGNAKMTEFQAAMGLCNLRHVEAEIARRGAAEARYFERLAGVAGVRIALNTDPAIRRNHAYFPVVVDAGAFGATRDEVFDGLAQRGVNARKYFYPCTNEFACYQGWFDPSATPIAHELSQSVLCLPMYADLSERDVDYVSDALLACRG